MGHKKVKYEIDQGLVNAAAGHKSAQEGGGGRRPRGGATGEVFNYTTANRKWWPLVTSW